MPGNKSKDLEGLLLNLKNRPRVRIVELAAEPTDAINETLIINGGTQPSEAELAALRYRELQTAQMSKRLLYRTRKKAEQDYARQSGLLVIHPVEYMSDAEVDIAIELEEREAQWLANQAQLGPSNPVWDYPTLTRQALGYYTTGEREQAALMNDMRSSTFFGSVMPNFGRQAAYYNPGAEIGAFRQTAAYVPNAVLTGSGFGLPSATQAVVNGLRTGWLTAGNVAHRIGQAGIQAARSAYPIVTNPRWLTTTGSFVIPAVASASNGSDYSGLVWPLAIGAIGAGAWLTKGKLWGKGALTTALTTTPTMTWAYKPKRGLFTWEYPRTWVSRQKAAAEHKLKDGIIEEWNAAVGDPVKEQAFITKYNIRDREGVPQFIDETVTRPKTQSVPKTEVVEKTVMEEAPSTVIVGSDGKPVMVQKPKLDSDGKPITESVEVQVIGDDGLPVMYDKPVIGDDGQPVMETVTVLKPKLGEDGLPVFVYNPIERKYVSDFLSGYYDSLFTSTIPNVDDMVFRGPTSSQQTWMKLRDVGRVGTWLTVPGILSMLTMRRSKNTSKNTSDNNTPNNQTPVSLDSVKVSPYISVTPDGKIITSNNDTITPNNYQVSEEYYDD